MVLYVSDSLKRTDSPSHLIKNRVLLVMLDVSHLIEIQGKPFAKYANGNLFFVCFKLDLVASVTPCDSSNSKINLNSKCYKLCLPPPIKIIHTRLIIPDPGPDELQLSKTALLTGTEPDMLNVFCGCK